MNAKDASYQGPLIDRRALLGSAASAALIVAMGPLADLARGAVAVPDAQPVVDALVSALVRDDVASAVSAEYPSLLSSLPADARAMVQRTLAEIGEAMQPAANAATPQQVRAALRQWLPAPTIEPPATAGDAALMRKMAVRYATHVELSDPSTWASARACPFDGDPTYQSSFTPTPAQALDGARVGFATYLVDLLRIRADHGPNGDDAHVFPFESSVSRLG